MYTVIVNATALDSGGALSILRQFVAAIPEAADTKYLIFIPLDTEVDTGGKQNVELVPTGVKSFRKRFMWDCFGLKRWLKKHGIKPDLTFSLQNTGFRTGYRTENFIYYHQMLPLTREARWSPMKPAERKLWFYKHIYPLFVRLFMNNRTQIIVQQQCTKKLFSRRFGTAAQRIHIVRPDVALQSAAPPSSLTLDPEKTHVFYPAAVFPYKNHQLLVEAMEQMEPKYLQQFRLYLTCQRSEFPLPVSNRIAESLVFTGQLPHTEIMACFSQVDALVFPSYIETFGLPLIEAASVGLPVLVADMPYAREVIGEYHGATFLPFDQPGRWQESLTRLVREPRVRTTPWIYSGSKGEGWEKLFEIFRETLNN